MDKIGHFKEGDARTIANFFRRRGDRKQGRPSRPRRRINDRTQQRIRLCVVNQDIAAGSSGAVTIWDSTVSPPVATTEIVEDVVLDWMHGGEQISAGRQAAFIQFGSVNRFMWSECEE